MIRSVVGNLLAAEVDALVNPVNCVGVMGKGLALQFRKAYPQMFREYTVGCQAGEVVPDASTSGQPAHLPSRGTS
jgi:O-acetyl-ADP-ribose deacetylase (regulator of RNase III)